jgi:hypothetical protein
VTQHVLIHIDQGLGPVGAWGYLDGQLTQFYPESLEPFISSRARELMAARRDITVPEYFALLAACDPTLLDDFHTLETSDGVSLPAALAEFRKAWNKTD